VPPSLPQIVFEITRACNLDCLYCYNIWKRAGGAGNPAHSYARAIRALKKLFARTHVERVVMTGGEPFLAERFPELVLFCRRHGKGVTIISNGNAAEKDSYKTMINLGVDLFEFPLHSHNPEVHDALTEVAGSWSRALRSIQEVTVLGARVIPVIVLTRLNATEIGETLKFIEGLGLKRIMLNRFSIGGRGISECQRLSMGRQELQSAFEEAGRAGDSLGLSLTSNVCVPLCFLGSKDIPGIRFTTCAYEPTLLPLTMDIEGNIRLCNHSPTIVGNVFREDLDAMFRSPFAQAWRNTVPEECSACTEGPRCLGGCRAASEQMGRTLVHWDPVLDF
jgi:radical SAM protein with 4Fe4S-binding SPASM domain